MLPPPSHFRSTTNDTHAPSEGLIGAILFRSSD